MGGAGEGDGERWGAPLRARRGAEKRVVWTENGAGTNRPCPPAWPRLTRPARSDAPHPPKGLSMGSGITLVSRLSASANRPTFMPMKLNRWMGSGKMLAAILIFAALSFTARAAEVTALELIKEGNRHVGEDSKDKVTQIRSEKSVGGLVPTIWFVVFYDADARMKATEVKFGGGKKMDVVRPFRLFERATGFQPMERAKLKIDSDEALKIALKEPLLEKLKLTNSKMVLEKGEDTRPVWKVTLWAEKAREPSKTVDIGTIVILAEDGRVLDRFLNINRID